MPFPGVFFSLLRAGRKAEHMGEIKIKQGLKLRIKLKGEESFRPAFRIVILIILTAVSALPLMSQTNWARKYSELEKRILPNLDEPRGYPPRLEPYLQWMERKARDRDEVKQLMKEAFDAARGNPEWAEKFQSLLKIARVSGENTAWDACFKFLRIKNGDSWQNTLDKVRNYGRIIFEKAAETGFDPGHVRDQWVKCLIRYSIHDVEVGAMSLYRGRLQVFAEYDEEGYMVIPKRDFNVNCERRINFILQEKGEAYMEADRGLAWVDDIREECRWWNFGADFADATLMMIEFFKEVLCKHPHDQSHKWFINLAKQYRLDEAREFAEGFYGRLYGTVWVEESEGRRPAGGAVITVTDPKDGTTWKAIADKSGKYEIKNALLHKTCAPFKIQAEHQGSVEQDIYQGNLEKPAKSAELNKDLVIHLDYWEGTITHHWSVKSEKGESFTTTVLFPGGRYAGDLNWRLKIKLKKDRGNENVRVYSLVRAVLETVEAKTLARLMELKKDQQSLELDYMDSAFQTYRELTADECELELAINMKTRTYSLSGFLKVKDIPRISSADLRMNEAPVNHRERDTSQSTIQLNQEFDLSGHFGEGATTIIKGEKDLMSDVPPDFQKFLKDLSGRIKSDLVWQLSHRGKK